MNRRDFLLLPLALKQAVAARLKITDVRVVELRSLKNVGTLEPAWNPGGEMNFMIGGGSYVEILTDQGLKGIGPGIAPDLLPAVKAQLIGKDPFDTEQHAG